MLAASVNSRVATFIITSLMMICITVQELYAQIQLESTTLTATTVASNLDTPWEILWGPDDRIWFTERGGKVHRTDPETGETDQLLQIDEVVEVGESGLLGMALHPNFTHPDSQFVYLVYTYNSSSLTEKLVRYRYTNNQLTDPVTLLDGIPAASTHDGSRVIITPERKIMFTTGDAQNTSLSQNTGSLAGKVLRLNLDGSIPGDNPIADSPIWSIGHRNPQGLVQVPDGTIYSSEHGPANDDEINIIQRNANYGWPNVQGFCDLSTEQSFCVSNNITEPVIAWTPTLAVAGIDYYDHEAIPEWRHAILLATLKEDDFRVLKLNAAGDAVVEETVYLNNEYGRLRDICVSPAGDIYFSTSNRDGRANDGFPAAQDDRIIRLSNEAYSVVTGLEPDENIAIFPNPATNMLSLRSESGTRILLRDMAGRVVTDVPYRRTLDVQSLRPGPYVLTIISETSASQFKFIKR
jgi:glucose/arabinose dehydrogenase